MTTRTSYFMRLLSLLAWAVLAASVMMVVLASPAWAATYTVTNTADSGAGSLRQAIIDANTTTGVADTINFELGSAATITLTSAQLPTITDEAGLTIGGQSVDITVSGRAVGVFRVASGAKLTLNNLTVTNGNVGGGFGGGIFNEGTLTVTNSTLSGNTGYGGGVYNSGTATVTNSTLSGNAAAEGGGIWNTGTATLKNTIVANSPSGNNCYGPITVGGYNLDSDNTCGFGTSNNSLSGVDPMLGPLADNGGPTETHALLEGSPAINKGNNAFAVDPDGNPLQFDQRGQGFARIVGGSVDIGAFEVQGIGSEPPPTGTPANKQECKKGGYKEFGFKNQGECIKAVKKAR
jgi:hypothetical protein